MVARQSRMPLRTHARNNANDRGFDMSQRGARPKPEGPARPRQRQGTAPPNPRSRDHGDPGFRFHRDGIRAGLAELAERLGARPPSVEPAAGPAEPAEPIGPDEAIVVPGEEPAALSEPVVPTEPATEPPNSPEAAARPEELRLLEALLFAAAAPVEEKVLTKRLPPETDVRAMLKRLALDYAPRGINLVRVGNAWAFRTANDLAWLLTHEAVAPKKLSRAAIETLAIIAYHQPVTRAEIEDIRGVAAAKGTLDVLLETGWIRPRGRRKAPGRPLTFGTTEAFLSHFGLEQLSDLPGLDELKGAGLFDGQLPAGFAVPAPSDDPALREDEEPLEPADLDLGLAPRPDPEG
jgi:segregation and condensation protein B